MKRILTILFTFYFSLFTLTAQEYPQGYFRNPMDFDIGLSATFGEFRTNHFHSGLDMRTGGAIGKPVYAAADGYVAKVSISPWGGGKILYIKHPNGYTTVYMHLDSYAGIIGRVVEGEQYRTKSYSINRTFDPGAMPVKKGQLVAYSGNSGGSGGPHLHFEVRLTDSPDLHTGARIINPLLFGLPYSDNIKPVIRGLRVYPVGGEPIAVGKDNSVSVDGPFYLGIYATDAAKGSTAKNGVHRVEVYLDGKLFFKYSPESLVTDSSRMVNALIDFPLFRRTRQGYLLTRILPGADGEWVTERQGDGVFRLTKGEHKIRVMVYDIKDNLAEQTLKVQVTGEKVCQKPKTDMRYTDPYVYNGNNVRVEMHPYTLYADDRMRIVEGNAVTVEPTYNPLPPHKNYNLSLKGRGNYGVPPEKVTIVRLEGAKRYASKTRHRDGWYTSQVRDFGTFTLAVDTTLPTVKPVNFSDAKLLKGNSIRLKIGDDLSGVETYNCYLNGSWILAEYDGKGATLTINASGKLKAGSNELSVEVTDACGNICQRRYAIRK